VPEYVVPLPWQRPPLTLNDRASRAEEWRLGNAIKDGTAYVLKGKIPRDAYPVTVELVWYPGNNKVADSDNIASTLKHCIDALVRTGVLPDDSPRYVVRTSQRVIPRDLDPHDRRIPALFLVVNTCEYADMPHYTA
jgi:crossover junction endodeoxyribonuclease RusA